MMSSPRGSIRLRAIACLIGVLVIAVFVFGCDSRDDPPSSGPQVPDGAVIATFDTAGAGTFRVLITDEVSVRRVLDGTIGEHVGIPNGRLVTGDGGVNGPNGWHLVDVEVVDMAMEVCDGTVEYLNGLGVERFMAEHGDRFCPWGAVLVDVSE